MTITVADPAALRWTDAAASTCAAPGRCRVSPGWWIGLLVHRSARWRQRVTPSY